MQQGDEGQRHSFQVRSRTRLIPLLCNGSSRSGLLGSGGKTPPLRSPFQLEGPFGFCAFAVLTPLLPGSLEIALKRTRPRQRFLYINGRYCMQ